MKLADEKQKLKDLETDNFGYWDLTKAVWGFLDIPVSLLVLVSFP